MNLNFLLLLCFFLVNYQDVTPDYVVKYHSVLSKKDELRYIETYQEKKNINIQAYVISLQMKQAKYKTFPWSKLSIFNKEKKRLDELIKTHPNNIHLRYVRLVIQEKTPKILGYNKNIQEDKSFLKIILKKKDSSDYLDKFIIKNTSL
ncbi:hypothetical protein [Tenacibaculum haliotis]|uniref:hypothetical protein n=1 Tax=Tenacibaculum haliotis TaxID=1888914 RepID=UPI0021B00578|nr:hypothetical protein [Tenacibaculum haliotis]MCT4699273.1 hypothetical protein [Tenacibaculum haliotis]